MSLIKKLIRHVLTILLLLTGTLGIGVWGFMYFEDYNFLDAFYMTVITMSTVGFREVYPLSPEGKVFTALFIITTFGIFTYGITTLTSFILSGEARKLIDLHRMQKRIHKMRGHVIICGFGRNGTAVVSELQRDGIPYVIIEHSPEVEETKLRYQEAPYIIADATQEKVLNEANIQHAKALITTLPSDADNLFVVLTALELNPNLIIISRASNESSVKKLKRAGAHYVILPEHVGGIYMARLISQPDIIEFINLLTSDYIEAGIYFEEIRYEMLKPEWHNKTIREMNIRGICGANIIGIKRGNDYFINPDPDFTLKPGDKLILLGTPHQIQKLKGTYLVTTNLSSSK